MRSWKRFCSKICELTSLQTYHKSPLLPGGTVLLFGVICCTSYLLSQVGPILVSFHVFLISLGIFRLPVESLQVAACKRGGGKIGRSQSLPGGSPKLSPQPLELLFCAWLRYVSEEKPEHLLSTCKLANCHQII